MLDLSFEIVPCDDYPKTKLNSTRGPANRGYQCESFSTLAEVFAEIRAALLEVLICLYSCINYDDYRV
jgi:hypothetical protein